MSFAAITANSPSAISSREEYLFARSCPEVFVRSQYQLAIDNERATGRKMTAIEVADAYGVEFLSHLRSEHVAALPIEPNAAGRQVFNRRQQYGYSVHELSLRTGLSDSFIEKFEAGEAQCPIRKLERVCRLLNLDDRRIGVSTDAKGNPNLRLRYFSMEKGDEHNFAESLVFDISQVFWVMNRTETLIYLGEFNKNHPSSESKSLISRTLADHQVNDYSYPAYRIGESLARKARALLGLGDAEPVDDIASLVRDLVGVQIIPVDWPDEYAGATLSDAGSRGVAINLKGMNERKNTLRFTIAHELGHVLCDRDDRLSVLKVSGDNRFSLSRVKASNRDLPELRANSFAAEFLMPKKGVQAIVEKFADLPKDEALSRALAEMQAHFGVGLTAAKYKLIGLGHQIPDNLYAKSINESASRGKEIKRILPEKRGVQMSKSGEFFDCVEKCFSSGLIHEDTKSSLLGRLDD